MSKTSWREIDGFINEEMATVVQELVDRVPDDGWIIEVGCYKGRQSALIAGRKKPSVRLSCIDPFPDTYIPYDDSQTYRAYTINDWYRSTEGYDNVEAVRGFSPFPISFLRFTRTPDLLILNVDRAQESLEFWCPHLGPRSRIVVHTYNYEHDRIAAQVEIFMRNHPEFRSEMRGHLALLSRAV